MNALDQIFGWLMIAFGVAQSVTNFRIQSASHLTLSLSGNCGGHDCQRFPQRIARPAQRWAHTGFLGDWESADHGVVCRACMACALPPAAQLAGSGNPHRNCC